MKAFSVAAVFAASLVLSGCSSVASLWTLESQTESVALAASPGVNNGFPVAVDVVSVSDEAFPAILAELPARTWFERKESFVANNGTVLRVDSFELLPGQSVEDIDFGWSDRRSVKAIFVFADYVTPGEHRGRLDAFARPTVRLGLETLSIDPGA